MTREEWLKKLSEQNDSGTVTWIKEHEDKAEKEKVRFWNDFKSGKLIPTAFGAFAPENDPGEPCDAYIDQIINPEEGGTFIKYYGCPLLMKGCFPVNVVRSMRLPKHLFSGFPRAIWDSSKLLSVFLALTWIFDRNGLLKIGINLTRNIKTKVVELSETWPPKSYNEAEKEIERALIAATKGEGLWEELMKHLAPFLKLFLFIDNTYKLRVQDALYDGGDLLDTVNILLRREQGIMKTWRYIKYGLKFAILTSPALKRISVKFFKELNKEKIKMDEADRFFAYLYKSYNFNDLQRPERKKIWLDTVNKHHIVFLR